MKHKAPSPKLNQLPLMPLPDPCTEEEPHREVQHMVGVLLQLTGMDRALNWARLIRPARKLLRAGYEPEQVLRVYNTPDGWWYTQDWRGRRGQPPTLGAIWDTIGRATENESEYSTEIQDT